MPSVFLSHSGKDKPFVRELADFLERDGEIRVWLDERKIAPGENIVAEIAEGLECDFVLLILSPDSVESAWVKEEWTDAFWEQTNQRRSKLAGVLYRDCPIPRLLRNKKYFDLRTNQPEGFRQIRTWLLNERLVPTTAFNLLPTRATLFVGRDSELNELRQCLTPGQVVAVSGMPGRGKTALALEFAHRYQSDFERVYWLPCAQQSLLAVAADLQRQLGLMIDGDLGQILVELKLECARKRTLLVLDNVENDDLAQLVPGGGASVLVTTRRPGLPFLRLQHRLALDLFTSAQCFDLFGAVLGKSQMIVHEAECRRIFERVGYLPLAVSVLASLIRDDVMYTISDVGVNLPCDVTAVIKEAIAALDSQPRGLLTAMAACAPQGFALSLAAELVGLHEKAALPSLQQLISRSLAEEVDRDTRRYRLHALVREAAYDGHFAGLHAEAVKSQFEAWETKWREREKDMADFQLALDWSMEHSGDLPKGFADELGYWGYALNRRIGHLAEAFELSGRMAEAAEKRDDKRWLQSWIGNRASIFYRWGRLEEAFELHRKEESICLEIGDKHGLQRTYGHQGIILRKWRRLEEALALHEKQEAICLELGDKDGLQRTYGNQALVLVRWQRLEEALALHKKEEALCIELGNKDGLQRTYGNQANILRKQGQLEEALDLLRKSEALCIELGQQSGLAYCYWSQGRLARGRKDPDEEQSKLEAAHKIFTDLDMPRERDAVAADLRSISIKRRYLRSRDRGVR